MRGFPLFPLLWRALVLARGETFFAPLGYNGTKEVVPDTRVSGGCLSKKKKRMGFEMYNE